MQAKEINQEIVLVSNTKTIMKRSTGAKRNRIRNLKKCIHCAGLMIEYFVTCPRCGEINSKESNDRKIIKSIKREI